MAHQLSVLNPRPKKLPGPGLLHHLVPRQSEVGAPAIDYLSADGSIEHVTYEELHCRANAIAGKLRTTLEAATIVSEPDHFVAPILIPQSIELYVSELAALKAGAAFCPISPDIPEARLRFILDDVKARVLLTTTQLRAHLPDLPDIEIILVDEAHSHGDENNDEDVIVDIQTSQPAYIMYTSGSTGQPKGVVLSHSAATQSLLAHDRHIPAFSRFLQFASPTFDVSVFEIFFPLFRGRTVVAGERRLLLNDLPAFINRMNVDAAELTPSVASNLLNGRDGLPSLQVLLTIGEMLKRDVIEEFGSTSSDEGILHGMYGPTEAAVHCTLQTSFSTGMSTSNIGIPLDTVSAFVIAPASAEQANGEVKVLPIGEEGELAVGGHQLADGYINRVEQTAASFINHREYGRLYRTGDRARLTSRGHLECLGRIASGQVKLRGQRVELGEIEYAASSTAGVDSTVVDVYNGSVVVFCISNANIVVDQVRRTCQKWLPAFMVPAHCILLSTLPLLPSGKVDRNILREMYDNHVASQLSTNSEAYESTSNLIDIISSVLQVPVNKHTPLSTLGLDSLSSIRIASQLRKAGLPQLDAMVLLESETVQDIGNRLTTAKATDNSSPVESSRGAFFSRLPDAVTGHAAVAGKIDQIGDVFAPTAVQLAMLSETARDKQAYCNWIQLSITGHEVHKVQICLQQLVSHHALLRSGFLAVNNQSSPYATIVWNTPPADHIFITDHLEYEFSIRHEGDLLHPCRFQLVENANSVHILIQIHHALYDQWSIDILRCDLETLLNGDDTLPPSISFRRMSTFQYANSHESLSYQSADFWQDYLMTFSPSLLPSMNGARVPKKLRRTQWQQLASSLSSIKRKSRDLSCSVPTVFQAAFAHLLGYYSGSSDVTFGLVVSGRHIPLTGIEHVFGPCLATLPFRIDFSATKTCLDLLQEVKSLTRDIQKYASTPLVDIRRMLELSTSDTFFNILFVWQESTLSSTTSRSAIHEFDSSDQHEFDFVLEFEPTENNVQIRVTYQQSLIAPEQVEIFVRQLESLSEAIVNAPNAPVSSLVDCFPRDLYSTSNPTPIPQATACDLSAAIERHAREEPNSPAIVFANDIRNTEANHEMITYSELDKQSNRMARFLRSMELLPDDLVCICMEKSVNLYTSILATFKAGAGYLPLTPETPTSRLKSVLDQSKAEICLCDDHTFQKFQSLGVSTIVNVDAIDLPGFETSGMGIDPTVSSIAYTVFTSGSTGEPKGVVVTRQNLIGNLSTLAELYKVRPGDRLLQACSQAFDVSVFEIFFAFYTGICLCSGPKDELFSDIEATIRSLQVTHLSLTPTAAALIDPDKVPTVKFLVTAGEGITELVHRRWAGKGLHQGYGPSETTNICTVKMDVSEDDALGNIGHPLANTSAFVVSLQSAFDVLPLGSIGELAFGGEQVFRGYLGTDELNAEKIIDHWKYGRIYKSGDMGRILADGTIMICGRKDDQVKIRGNRVELGEINAVLLNDPNVRDCTTSLIGDDVADQMLVSFVVVERNLDSATRQSQPGSGEGGDLSYLFTSLEYSLPSYMIPNLIIPLERLPLTSQGKLDKQDLRRLVESLDAEEKAAFGNGNQETDTRGDWSLEEDQIATAISDTVHIPNTALSRNSSFFSLGLNSLNAISFAKTLEARLKIPVAVSTILKHSTISRLARVLSENTSTKPPNGDFALLPVRVTAEVRALCNSFQENVECILPCTPLQQAMLAASANSAESKYYNSLDLTICGNVEKIKDCWTYMVKRHQILRTRFVSTSDPLHPYVQVVLKDSPLPWREHHLASSDSPPPSETAINGNIALIGSQPFEIRLLSFAQGKRMTLNMHHAIYDAISMSTLLNEVELVYRDIALPKPISFEPFLTEVQSHNREDAIAFWKTELSGFLPTPFPVAATAEPAQEIMLHRQLKIDHGDLSSFCQRHAVGRLAIFQAALVKVLACCQRSADVCFGNVVSGRTVFIEGIERLVAPCFNTIPVRTALDSTRTNSALIRHLNHKNSDMLMYQLTSLRSIQRMSSDPSKRLFDTVLIFQPKFSTLDASIWRKEDEAGNMGLPLVFEIAPQGQTYTLTLHFLSRNISNKLAEALVKAYAAAITECLTHPYEEVRSFYQFDSNEIAGCLLGTFEPENNLQTGDGCSDDQWSSEEDTIRQVYSQLSNVHRHAIERDTSMYQLGLDSLNAPQVACCLRKLGFDVDAADVIETLTPAALAALIWKKSSQKTAIDAPVDFIAFQFDHLDTIVKSVGVDQESVEAVRPCTSVQNGMLAQSLTSNGQLYINHITYNIPRDICLADIEAAWSLVSCRHQMLRSGFCQLDSGSTPFAVVIYRPSTFVAPIFEDYTCENDEDAEREISRGIVESIQNAPWRVTIKQHTTRKTMVLSLHHALYDARSLKILLSDFATALSGRMLPPPTNIDGLLIAHLTAEADRDGQAAKYWKDIVQDLSISKFPDLTPTSVNESALRTNDMTSTLKVSDLDTFCKANHATVQALGQTAWALLIAAYTGNDNVVFGTVFSGPATTENNNVAFPCINTIPVPCRTSQSLLELIQNMVRFNASSQRYRFIPLTDIQKHAGRPDRVLFDTVFVYQKSSNEMSTFNWPVLRETAAVDYSASLELEAHSDHNISICLTYNTALIPPKQAELIVQQYDHVLSEIVTGRRPYPAASQSILSISPPVQPILSSDVELLHEFVERSAREHPSRTALEFVREARTDVWSYLMLDKIANQVAHLIRQFGVQPNSMIAVCMDKCPEASFAFVGILKAGCSFLAIDPDLPHSRLEFILEDSGSQLLLGDKAEQPPGMPDSTKYFHLTQAALNPMPKCPIAKCNVQSNATCYCLYTSGTTGTPKGCEISHENAVQAMLAFMRLFQGRWTQSSKWLQFASYWFDVSVLEQFWSWAVGITVVVAPRDLVLEDIPAFIRRLGITHIDLTPSLARLVQPDEVPSLRNGVFITGGEPLKQEIIKAWGPTRTVCNGYGPTEATIGVTMNSFVGPDAKSYNIGRQFDNVGTYVLHPGSDEPVFRGCVGELCVSGKLVGKGYLNRPDLTARHFPILPRFNETIYRTGDLVRQLNDGSFAFVGRADSQSKLRGQRLELTEIDNTIRQGSGQIHDVVTLVVTVQEGGKETLIAFLATGTGSKAEQVQFDSSTAAVHLVQTARDACTSYLPGYMVPTHILAMNRLPLTVNNKVDAKRLTAMFKSTSLQELQALQRVECVARTLSETEQRICDILRKVLQLDSISATPRSNLFSLGLSSISAIPFTRLLKRAGFQSVNIGLVMRNSTIERLGYALSNTDQGGREDQATKQAHLWMAAFHHRHLYTAAKSLNVSTEAIEAVLPCTQLQQGLVIESLKEASKPHFNTFLYEIVGGSLPRLQSSIEMLAELTQVLRTRFVNTDEGLAQGVMRPSNFDPFTWSVPSDRLLVFLSELTAQWQSRNKSSLVTPVEFHFIETGEQTYLRIHIHHALYDGISYPLMLRQLYYLYSSHKSPETGPTFTTALAHGPLRPIEGAEEFWKSRLCDSKYHSIPELSSRDVSSSAINRFVLSEGEAIETIRKNLGVSHQAILQSCFEVALHHYDPSIEVYGIVCSGRSIDLEGADLVVGPMFNTLPQPLQFKSGSSLSEDVQRCHSSNTESIPYQHTPLRDIRRWCGDQFSAGIFDVLFVFQHAPEPSPSKLNEILKHVDEASRAHYGLAFEAEMDHEGIVTVTLLAQDTVFNDKVLRDLQAKFCETLDYLINKPNTVLQDIIGNTTRHEDEHTLKHPDPSPPLNGVQDYRWTAHGLHIREIVAELASVDRSDIDEHSSLFALGLDSIDAVRLSSRLTRAGLPISVSKILKAQTIPRMLDAVKSRSVAFDRNGHSSALEVIQQKIRSAFDPLKLVAENIEQILPATPFQEALVAGMVRSEFKQYFNHDLMRLRTDTDVERLVLAWQCVFDSSPILRTSFMEIADPAIECTFAQIVHTSTSLELLEFELSDVTEVDGIFDKIRLEVLNRFQSSPPLQLSVVRIQSQTYMILSLSHALYDGHSIALLHDDVHRAYEGEFEARTPYKDAVTVALEVSEDNARAYWTSALLHTQMHNFPRIANTEEPLRVFRAERRSEVSSMAARTFCKEYSVSMQALAQTCWAITLAHYVRSLDVQFGVALACRDGEKREQMMFPMMNTVVMRASLHGSRVQMVQHIQGLITDMRPYQRTPLRQIQSWVAECGSRISTLDNGLFDTLFIYQQKPVISATDSERLYDSVDGQSVVEYPLAIEIEAVGDTLMIRAACASSIMDQTGCVQLLERLNSVLQAIIRDSSRQTVDFHMGKVSLCSLEAVHLNSVHDTYPEADGLSEERDADVGQSSSLLMASIVQVLSHVSKTPETEISPSSVIESIGIDSISAIKVAALLRHQSIRLSVSEIIRAKTPARMAAIALEKTDSDANIHDAQKRLVFPVYDLSDIADTLNVEASKIETVLPRTAGQIYMLSMWKKTNGQQFCSTFSYRLKTDLTLERLQQAWSLLVDRHPILRTEFCISPDPDKSLLQVVLRDAQESFQSHGVVATKQPMVSMRAVLESNGFMIELSIHHALYDAVSLPLLLEDFQKLLSKKTPAGPKLKFEDFLALSTGPAAMEHQKVFWTRYLQGLRPRFLMQPGISGAQNRVEIFQPALYSSVSELESKARKEGVTIQAVLFAAYAKVYASIVCDGTGGTPDDEGSDVVIGVYLSNRSHLPDLDKLPAPTLNLVPLVVRRPQEQSLVELAKQIQIDLQEISTAENSAVGLVEIYEWTGVRVDTFVNFLRLPEREGRASGEDGNVDVVLEELDDRRTKERCEIVEAKEQKFEVPAGLEGLQTDAYQHSLDIEMTITEGKLGVGLFCPESMLGLQEAEKVVEEFKSLLEKVVGKEKELAD